MRSQLLARLAIVFDLGVIGRESYPLGNSSDAFLNAADAMSRDLPSCSLLALASAIVCESTLELCLLQNLVDCGLMNLIGNCRIGINASSVEVASVAKPLVELAVDGGDFVVAVISHHLQLAHLAFEQTLGCFGIRVGETFDNIDDLDGG
jgi:hypothetical protein